jgi:hypothetical protein
MLQFHCGFAVLEGTNVWSCDRVISIGWSYLARFVDLPMRSFVLDIYFAINEATDWGRDDRHYCRISVQGYIILQGKNMAPMDGLSRPR